MARAIVLSLLVALASTGTSPAEESKVEDAGSKAIDGAPGSLSAYPWYLIDAPVVVCVNADPPAPGKTTLSLNLTKLINASDLSTPHIFTLYRETNHTVKLTFKVTDADGQVVVDTTDFDLDAFDNETQTDTTRRLALKRHVRKASRSGKSSHPSMAAFSYGSSGSLQNNFPRGFRKTSYGYSGRGAYHQTEAEQTRSVGAMLISAALGLDPAMPGSGRTRFDDEAQYTFTRWHSTHHKCHAGPAAEMEMTCADCAAKHGLECAPELPKQANRDDLMSTGFWPDDYKSPLQVTITSVQGADFSPNDLCKSGDATRKKSNESASEHLLAEDIFLTLTKVAEMQEQLLGQEMREKYQEESKEMAPVVVFGILAGVCGLICCFACCALFVRKCCGVGEEEEDREGYTGLRLKP